MGNGMERNGLRESNNGCHAIPKEPPKCCVTNRDQVTNGMTNIFSIFH